MKKSFGLVVLLFLSVLGFGTGAAADPAIYHGIDVWHTRADQTYSDFRRDPIPAGFFCADSPAFRGRIYFKGVPIATGKAGALGRADTIIQRLDDAVFNARGVARTRVQVKALQLESVAPLKTSCGKFHVRVSLAGEQPITTMRIFRDSEDGGRFSVPLNLNTRLTFIPVDRKSNERFEIARPVRFRPNQNASWAFQPGDKAVRYTGYVQVDTDADGRPDTYLPGTSNFAPGWWRMGDKAGTSSFFEMDEVSGDTHAVQ